MEKCVTLRFCRGGHDLSGVGSLATYNISGSDLSVETSTKDLGILVDSTLKFHGHVQQVVAKAWGLANNFLRSTHCRSVMFMCAVYVTHIRPLLEFSSTLWNTGYVMNSRLLESVQCRWDQTC